MLLYIVLFFNLIMMVGCVNTTSRLLEEAFKHLPDGKFSNVVLVSSNLDTDVQVLLLMDNFLGSFNGSTMVSFRDR